MAHLALSLLGPFQATLNGQAVGGLNSTHLRALLAYMAVERGREHPREALAALLWPERPDREALSALRNALSKLHSALGDRRSPCPFLLITRTHARFNAASDHWLDVSEFLDLTGSQDLSGLTRAAQLYRGPFLHGLSVADSPAFDDWMLLKDDEYRRNILSVLGHLAHLQTAREDYVDSAHWARRQLELEPYREQAHRQLMAALALGGDRPAALAHFETCRRLLVAELGCEPDDETRALYAQIRDGTLPQRSSSVMPGVPVVEPVLPPDDQPSPRFVAREGELARLDKLLRRALAGHGGMALISGEAGSGKTALLDEFARRAGQVDGDLIALRGQCNAHGGAGDPYLPFRELLQTLAGDVESKRAGGTLSAEGARRVWEALPVLGAALVEHGPGLIDIFVPGEALLRRAEGFPGPAGSRRWVAALREVVQRAREGTSTAPGAPPPTTLQTDLFGQVTQMLRAFAASKPLLLVIDDLQWADGGTAALLFHLGRHLAGSRILLACAYRPEALQQTSDPEGLERPLGSILQELIREWGDIRVDLDQADGREFVEAYVDSEPNCLDAAFRQALYSHSGGNPLFTIELLRSFQRDETLVQDEAGRWVPAATGGPDWERWPAQVEAVIAGHLASLGEEDRALLQAASVQGEQFVAEVVARVQSQDEDAVVRRLSGPLRTRHRLVEAVSLDRLASSPGQRLSRYRFRHVLLQVGAYRRLDAVERARLHEATGQALETLYAAEPDRLLALAPDLARHLEAADLPLKAARYRLEAARWAAHLLAYDEAVVHLERGLKLLEGEAPSRERLSLELRLWRAITTPAAMLGGWQAPTLAQALERMSGLIRHPALRDDPQCLAGLSMLAMASIWSDNPAQGERLAEQLLALAAKQGSGQVLMLGHCLLGHSAMRQGKFSRAREHLELALRDPGAALPVVSVATADPAVLGQAILGWTLWLQGYADQGRTGLRKALGQAEQAQQPATVAAAHGLAQAAHWLLGRDAAAARSHVTTLSSLGHAGQFYGGFGGAMGAPGQDLGLSSEQGDDGPPYTVAAHAGLEHGQGEVARPALGFGGQATAFVARARLAARAGQLEAALQALDDARAFVERSGVRTIEAEVWRTRGELLLTVETRPHRSQRPVRSDDAETCFRRALKVAREQGARWWELRAAVSMARLWQAQGRRDEARELLAGIYGWFTEGFDTVDLVEAKALLEELQ